jgi:hypothetical protein
MHGEQNEVQRSCGSHTFYAIVKTIGSHLVADGEKIPSVTEVLSSPRSLRHRAKRLRAQKAFA